MASTPRYKPAVELKSGDLRPTVTHTIRDRNGDPIDLSNAEAVRFYMQHPDEEAPRVNATMDILNAEEGFVEYEWQEGDTARADRHHAEFVIHWPDGSGGIGPQTDPATGYYFFDFDTPIGRGEAQDFDGRVDITVGHITADSISASSVTVANEPANPTDAVRLSDLGELGGGAPSDHDHTGDTLNPDAVNSGTVDSEFSSHSNTLTGDHTLPAGKGSVIAGELSGTGSITGDGDLAIVDEGIHRAVKNPVESTVDAAGNDITNAGSIDSGSVNTEEANTGVLHSDRQTISPQGDLMAERQMAHHPFQVANKTRVFGPSDLSWTSQSLYWGNIVHAGGIFSSPIDEYYLYYSEDHGNPGAIALATAPDPMGPWTDEGVVFSTTAERETPTPVYDPDNNRLNLYYHSGSIGREQSTSLAYTDLVGDGTTFTDLAEPIIDVPQGYEGQHHTGYPRVNRVGRQWVCYHLMGGGSNNLNGVSYSNDGVTWWTDPQPLSMAPVTSGTNDIRIAWNQSNIFNFNGSMWWVGGTSPSGSSGGAQTSQRVVYAPMLSPRKVAYRPQTLIEPTEDWEGTDIKTPGVFLNKGRIYVCYSSAGRLGVAELTGRTY